MTMMSNGNQKKKRKFKGKNLSSNESVLKEKKKIVTPWFQQKLIWDNFIKKHRSDLKKAEPMVDDKPPNLNVANIYDVEILNSIRQSLKGAFDMNQSMVKRLHEVHIKEGKTGTFSFNYSQPRNTNYESRKNSTKIIEKQNHILSKIIKNAQTKMETAKYYAEQWKQNEMIMESTSQFPLFWKVKKEKESKVEISPPIPHFRQFITEKSMKYGDKRPRICFEVAIVDVGVIGKLIAMLYSDYVPMTVKNFLAFCNPKSSMTYKGNLFYLIFQNYYCLTGDVVENKGYKGTSIYGPYFGNEDLTLKHGERGVMTMYNHIPNRNESRFLITFRKLESLDGENVVFGKIIKGFHVLDIIESVGSKKTGRPKVEIYISDCDEI